MNHTVLRWLTEVQRDALVKAVVTQAQEPELSPYHSHGKQSMVACMRNASVGRRSQQVPGIHWLASLAQSVRARSGRDPASKTVSPERWHPS